MSTTPYLYASTDTSAPSLTGQAGSFISFLDAILVNGYGATPAAGWTKVWSGTNQACYRNNPSTGTGLYLYVDDTTTTYAAMRGFESFNTTLGVGTNGFPTSAQEASGVFVSKSSSANSVARPWVCSATQNSFAAVVDRDSTTGGNLFAAGDFVSVVAGDTFNFLVMGNTANTNSDMGGSMVSLSSTIVPFTQSGKTYVARDVHASVGGVLVSPSALFSVQANQSCIGGSGVAYPYQGMSGTPLLYECVIHSTANSIRGAFPLLVVPVHARPFTHLQALPGMGVGGENLVAVNLRRTSGDVGQVLLRTS